VTELAEPALTARSEPASLVDLLDRVLAAGIVLSGDVTVSLAGIDLITIKLRALVSTVRPEEEP
jgi:hypothetical protein